MIQGLTEVPKRKCCKYAIVIIYIQLSDYLLLFSFRPDKWDVCSIFKN